MSTIMLLLVASGTAGTFGLACWLALRLAGRHWWWVAITFPPVCYFLVAWLVLEFFPVVANCTGADGQPAEDCGPLMFVAAVIVAQAAAIGGVGGSLIAITLTWRVRRRRTMP